jgi:hypothetical protein
MEAMERDESSAKRHDVGRPGNGTPGRPARKFGLTPRRPGIHAIQVSSQPFAGVVQWQNISFPS